MLLHCAVKIIFGTVIKENYFLTNEPTNSMEQNPSGEGHK
jgi:hypothetical protein